MSTEFDQDENEKAPEAHRLFLHEPGWRVSLKVGSERDFCYAMAPGDDHYHRMLDGEVFLHNAEERLCLACAERRGLLSYKPKGLRDPVPVVEIIDDGDEEGPGVYRRETKDSER
jgi:hypothetical protein